ncbi:MAG: autoinducer binding domain-containing protein, partial [Pseudomonadota bacterium]
MKALLTTCAEIEHLADTPQVWRACVAALAKAGLPVAMHLSSDAARKDIRVLSTHPEIHKSQAAADDPFLEWCCSSYDITKTGVAFLDDYPYLAEDEKAFIRAAEAHGFRSGLAVPMRLESSGRFGGFNLGTGLDRAAFLDQIFPHFEAIRFFCLVAQGGVLGVRLHLLQAAMYD